MTKARAADKVSGVSEISKLTTVSGSPLTPGQQADEALVGRPVQISQGETAQEAADAELVDLSAPAANSTNISSELQAGVPADLAAAGALVSELAGQIGGAGSEALSAQSLITADAAYKLTKS